MKEISINKQAKLSDHFTLGELTKTSVKTEDGNIPSHVHIENLKRVCGWLERLRLRCNQMRNERNEGNERNEKAAIKREQSHACMSYAEREQADQRSNEEMRNEPRGEVPIVINSGYRSPQVNKAVGGAPGSNHLTGCAVDIRCKGIEQAIRYAFILLDISEESGEPYDELLIEKSAKSVWVHFAVKPCENRQRVDFLNKK